MVLNLKKKLGIPLENCIVGSFILGYRKDGQKIEIKDKTNISIITK